MALAKFIGSWLGERLSGMVQERLAYQQETQVPYASITRRFAALVLDGIFVGLPFFLLGLLFTAGSGGVATPGFAWFQVIILVFYWTFFEGTMLHATPGKKLMKIRVVTTDGDSPSIFRAFVRALGRIAGGFFLGLGYLLALFSRRSQGFHDLISGTMVVEQHFSKEMLTAPPPSFAIPSGQPPLRPRSQALPQENPPANRSTRYSAAPRVRYSTPPTDDNQKK